MTRDPKQILSEMLGPNLHTTYGWELRNLETRGGRRDIFYQGYMRVILGAKDEVLANSGRRGYFFEALAKDMMEKFPVKWEEPIEGETDASYFQRVRELAETGKKPARAVAAASGCDCRTVKKCRSLPAHTGAMVCPICGATRMLSASWNQPVGNMCKFCGGLSGKASGGFTPRRLRLIWLNSFRAMRISSSQPPDVQATGSQRRR